MHTVWLIRHGQSQTNIGRPAKYTSITGLTGVGRDQAKEILTAFSAVGRIPSLIITSKYRRSTDTALPAIKSFPKARWEQRSRVHEFTYLSPNNCQSTTREERRSLVEKFWLNNEPTYRDGDGAESFEEFIKRAQETISQLRFSSEDFIVVYSHGQFIQAILWLLDTSPISLDATSKESFRRFCAEHPVPNGAIVPIEFDGTKEPFVKEMLLSHLGKQTTGESGENAEDTPAESREKEFAAVL